jgi:HAE1 family hydrophobic/amphiphilic exporter-1
MIDGEDEAVLFQKSTVNHQSSVSPVASCRRLRRGSRPPPARGGRHNRLYNASEPFFSGMLKGYKVSLAWVLRHGLLMVLVFVVLLVATGYLFVIILKDFIASPDTGQIFGFTEAAQDISFDDMVRHQRAVNRILAQDPPVLESMSAVIGGNRGIVFIHLKPRSQRRLSAGRVIQELNPRLAQVPGMRALLQNPPRKCTTCDF